MCYKEIFLKFFFYVFCGWGINIRAGRLREHIRDRLHKLNEMSIGDDNFIYFMATFNQNHCLFIAS